MHYRKTFSCLVASTRIISQQCLNLELFPLPAARNVCTRAYIRVRKIKRAAHGALFRRTFVSGEVTYRCDPGSCNFVHRYFSLIASFYSDLCSRFFLLPFPTQSLILYFASGLLRRVVVSFYGKYIAWRDGKEFIPWSVSDIITYVVPWVVGI